MDNQKTGALIRQLRTGRGMTQKDLARQLAVTDRAVSKWERGYHLDKDTTPFPRYFCSTDTAEELDNKKRRYATPPRGAYRLSLLSSPPAVSVEQKSAWEWCGIFI